MTQARDGGSYTSYSEPRQFYNSTSTLASSTCTRDWIEIEGSSEACTERGNLYSRYCGLTFGTNIASDTDQNFNTTTPLSEIFSMPQRTVCDCTLPFSVGIRTSNETRGGAAVNEIRGQKWDQEEQSLHARGVCLNYEQILCN